MRYNMFKQYLGGGMVPALPGTVRCASGCAVRIVCTTPMSSSAPCVGDMRHIVMDVRFFSRPQL